MAMIGTAWRGPNASTSTGISMIEEPKPTIPLMVPAASPTPRTNSSSTRAAPLVSSCYKWLLATHGVGLFAYSARRVGELVPATVGWHSVAHRGGLDDPLAMSWRADASRLEAGNPSLLGLAVLDNAVERLERLAPEGPEERAGNVCFLADDAAGLATALAARRVLVWGGEGRIRVSPHVHCDSDDVERFFLALDQVGARPPQPAAAR